jgi:hypothetical protein
LCNFPYTEDQLEYLSIVYLSAQFLPWFHRHLVAHKDMRCNICTFFRKSNSNRTANAAISTSNNGNFILQLLAADIGWIFGKWVLGSLNIPTRDAGLDAVGARQLVVLCILYPYCNKDT